MQKNKILNWGNGIILVYSFFVLGIGYLVYRSTQTEFDLVEDDYYQKELEYQNDIDEYNRAIQMNIAVDLVSTETSIIANLYGFNGEISAGEVWFYSPTSKSNDKKYKLNAKSGNVWAFPVKDFNHGKYEVKIHWKDSKGKGYRLKQEILL